MNAILTINLRDILLPNARASFRAAAARWGCEYVEVTEWGNPQHPANWKCDAFDIVPDAERLFIIDADAVISGLCPNPFTEFDPEDMIVVSDRQTHCPARLKAEQDEWGIVTGGASYPVLYFNSGVILASRAEHEEIFEEAAAYCARWPDLCWHDQTPFNVAVARRRQGNVRFADESWNFHNPAGRLIKWQGQERHIYHFPGNPDRNAQIAQVRWQ